MNISNLNPFNTGHLIDSVTFHIADQLDAKNKPKQRQTDTFAFNGAEYAAAPKPRHTMIPMPRIG